MNDGIEGFLERNNVKNGWKRLILEEELLRTELEKILSAVSTLTSVTPQDNVWFKAFSYFEPNELKAILIGQDPLPLHGTGLSFSMDCDDSDIAYEDGTYKSGHAVWMIHEALKEAKILEKDKIYSCGHEEWAQQGVLLLNAALTVPNWVGNVHIWNSFMKKLLNKLVCHLTQDDDSKRDHVIFVVHMGWSARNLWTGVIDGHKEPFRAIDKNHPAHSDMEAFKRNLAPDLMKIQEQYPGIFSLSPKDEKPQLVQQNPASSSSLQANHNGTHEDKSRCILPVHPGNVTPLKNGTTSSFDNLERVSSKSPCGSKNLSVGNPHARRELRYDDVNGDKAVSVRRENNFPSDNDKPPVKKPKVDSEDVRTNNATNDTKDRITHNIKSSINAKCKESNGEVYQNPKPSPHPDVVENNANGDVNDTVKTFVYSCCKRLFTKK